MTDEHPKPLLRLSIPVKVLLFTGAAYGLFQLFRILLEVQWEIDFSAAVWGVSLEVWYTAGTVFALAIVATISSYLLLDRPLVSLQRLMERAEKGDLMARIPENVRDELRQVSHHFDRMLHRLADLAAEKAKADHALSGAHDALKYRGDLGEQNGQIAEANRVLENVVKDLSILYEIGQQVTTIIDLDSLYTRITASLKRYLHIAELSVMIYDEERDELHVRAASGFEDDERVMRMVLRRGDGIAGLAAEMRKKVYVRDTNAEKRFMPFKGERLSRCASLLAIPLIYNQQLQGVINYGRFDVGAFTSADVKMLSLVANQVALAIANAKLYTRTRELAVRDELTGLYNRRHLQQMLSMEWKRAIRFHRDLSIVMIDVDYFKKYNDKYGHPQGDQILRLLGKLLVKHLREVDTVARFGGEEFVLLLPDTDKRGAIVVAEKIRKLVEKELQGDVKGERQQTTISCGVASYPDDVAEMDDLIDHADIALYRAKEEGRNRVICYASARGASETAEQAEPPIAPDPHAHQQQKKKFISTLQ